LVSKNYLISEQQSKDEYHEGEYLKRLQKEQSVKSFALCDCGGCMSTHSVRARDYVGHTTREYIKQRKRERTLSTTAINDSDYYVRSSFQR
jgi:hypothetical protein